jgi:hypothetical protein
MTRIDKLFRTTSWEENFPTAHLYPWASTISDHCPLILQGKPEKHKFKGFRFEFYWLAIPGFNEVSQDSMRW